MSLGKRASSGGEEAGIVLNAGAMIGRSRGREEGHARAMTTLSVITMTCRAPLRV